MTLSALQDLFSRHRERATGIWKLGQDPNRTIFLDSGDIVFAQSTHPLDRLTHLLVERGKLTQEQLDYAMGNLKPGLSIGKNLIEMGFITQRDLLEVARAQVERVVWGALGTPDSLPDFDARELDATIVRLPMDTPTLLLNCLLNLQDRERLLELLGPLNQVVALQGRRLLELPLPPDLAKLPPLLDGSRTLLELGREVAVEPIRLGILALFLREVGWAKLHELPPLDRQALDLALAPEPQPLSPPLPELQADAPPSLFSTIRAAAAPTTNLEHLSEALDTLAPQAPTVAQAPLSLPELQEPTETALEHDGPQAPEPPLPDPDLSLQSQTPREMPPTPNVPLPEWPEEPEPAVPIETAGPVHDIPEAVPPEPDPPPFLEESPSAFDGDAPPPRRGLRLLLPVLAALALVALGAYWWAGRRARPSQPPEAPAPTPPPQPKATPPPSGIAVPADALPPTSPATPPAPATESAVRPAAPPPESPSPKPSVPALDARLAAITQGDLALATRHGEAYRASLPSGNWTLRLEIACKAETIRDAVGFFGASKPDLWLVPIRLKNGLSCYQVFLGAYPNRAASEKAVAALPAPFTAGGNRPRPFAVENIPSAQ